MPEITWWTSPWRIRGRGRGLARGLAAGFALPATVMLVLWAGGAISLQRSTEPVASVASAAISVVVLTALVEEILARYLIFRLIEWRAGARVALAVTTLLFGLLHFAVASIVDEMPSALLHAVPATLTGLLFAGAYLLSRTMWLPIALHIGWNLATNAIFGPDVFGAHRLMTVTPLASEPLSGGPYGTDASVLTSAVLVPLCLALLLAASRRAAAPEPRSHLAGTDGAAPLVIATASTVVSTTDSAMDGGPGRRGTGRAEAATVWAVREGSERPVDVTRRRTPAAGDGAGGHGSAGVRRVPEVSGRAR